MAHWMKRAGSILPFWKRTIPPFPVYWKGDPKNRVFLPTFWMKLVKPDREMPPDYLQFIVHKQMSTHDVKNYLEKIYEVPVLRVRTEIRRGIPFTKEMWLKYVRNPGYPIHQRFPRDAEREMSGVINFTDEFKVAYVQVPEEVKFTWPDIFKENKPLMEKALEERKKFSKEQKRLEKSKGSKDLPAWFR
ncbi:probable 39S ribosomal protein L23, mitochondrial [Lingula anatina]|uniref:Large ribosomal subunit protein uL23m n=1 Tax=Lingula anatina TaxID=7574 RepID=A0A1S3H5L2_LINAN|nr:probable 39S ribosomal protein L23, mitochondrial [Lingula anatina]|eukprot:XP_013381293.1 probable 39S ribosomal protein L23, mitochondrial [Lingula anatina]